MTKVAVDVMKEITQFLPRLDALNGCDKEMILRTNQTGQFLDEGYFDEGDLKCKTYSLICRIIH